MQAGDVGFARTTGVMGRLIRVGEHLRFRRGSQWNHMFIISQAGLDPPVIQATLRGVTSTAPLSSVAPGGKYTVLSPPGDVDREKLLAFANAQVGVTYGFGTILAIAIDIVTWNWVPSLRGARKNSWICSALVLEALRHGGWYHEWVNIYTVTPSQGFAALSPPE